MSLLLLGVTLGLDSFRACVGVAALNDGWRRHALVAVAFGTSDGLGMVTGLALGGAMSHGLIATTARYVGPTLLIVYGAALICAPRHAASGTRDLGYGWMLVSVPVALSLDNLVSGAALGLAQFPVAITAAIVGAISGVMALAGLRLGRIVIRLVPLRSELTAGTMMVLVGAMLAAD
jgi:putative Mn2+ efflux pump MntP